MKFLTAFIFLLVLGQNLLCETNLQGRVMDNKGKALVRINVLVYVPGSKVLITFAVSDSEGRFQTIVNSPTDSLDIQVSSIQFRNEHRSIANTSQTLQFEIVHEVKQLETWYEILNGAETG